MTSNLTEFSNSDEEKIIHHYTTSIYELILRSQTLPNSAGKKVINFENYLLDKLFRYNITFSHHQHPGTYTPWNITIEFNEVTKNAPHYHFEVSFDESGNLVKYVSYQKSGSSKNINQVENRIIFPSNDLSYIKTRKNIPTSLTELGPHLSIIRTELDTLILEQQVRADARSNFKAQNQRKSSLWEGSD